MSRPERRPKGRHYEVVGESPATFLCLVPEHSFQVSAKYGLIYVITKLGLLFVYDLETATAVYRNRISPDPIFLACDAPAVGGFYAVNRRGQVLLATVNEQTMVPFVSGQVREGRWNQRP